MAERLPRPFIQVGFNEEAALPDCLRSMSQTSRTLRLGILFEREGREYLVQPEMPIDHVLSLADPELGQSVRDHMDERSA